MHVFRVIRYLHEINLSYTPTVLHEINFGCQDHTMATNRTFNRRIWTSLAPLESCFKDLSNGGNVAENGYYERNLWWFEVGEWDDEVDDSMKVCQEIYKTHTFLLGNIPVTTVLPPPVQSTRVD